MFITSHIHFVSGNIISEKIKKVFLKFNVNFLYTYLFILTFYKL